MSIFLPSMRALSARDINRITSHWGVPALVLSDEGAIAVAKVKEVEVFFASSMNQYEKVASAHPTIRSALPLSENVIAWEVVWDHHDEVGKSVGGEAGYYVLRHNGKGLQIHVYTPKPG